MKIAETPKAPYYAVVFTIVAGNTNEEDWSIRMVIKYDELHEE